MNFLASSTINICGRCGDTTRQDEIVIVSEKEFGSHYCGFLGIRHRDCGGETAARRAVLAHLRRQERKEE